MKEAFLCNGSLYFGQLDQPVPLPSQLFPVTQRVSCCCINVWRSRRTGGKKNLHSHPQIAFPLPSDISCAVTDGRQLLKRVFVSVFLLENAPWSLKVIKPQQMRRKAIKFPNKTCILRGNFVVVVVAEWCLKGSGEVMSKWFQVCVWRGEKPRFGILSDWYWHIHKIKRGVKLYYSSKYSLQ